MDEAWERGAIGRTEQSKTLCEKGSLKAGRLVYTVSDQQKLQIVAADIKQDIHLLWEKTEAELLSLAQRFPTMVNLQGRPPPSQAREAFVLFCPSKFAERRKLIPHPQSNSAVTPFSESLSMLSHGAQAA